jgi:dTDP-4-amino-4,6-dideoxygalactose transaminase
MNTHINRREFVSAATAVGVGLAFGGGRVFAAETTEKPALLGGKPVRDKSWPSWPVKDQTEENAILEVLRGGKWFRGGGHKGDAFEQSYAKLTGAKHCIATNSGTSALVASLGALGVGPGDEVIVTPYTFIASVTSIMLHHALPVFVDVDPESFLIDPAKIEAAITERTAAIMPVHIGGNVSEMDAVLAVAKKHDLPVVEDACQAHLAQWHDRSVGTWGTTGCFSFQVTKNLSSGEGGAILTDDDSLAERIYAFHNNCRARRVDSFRFAYAPTRAANFRMTEFQGALLMAQMTRLEKQSQTRDENAKYLAKLLAEIPGLHPAKMYDGCTRNAWHLFMMRYDAEQFAGLPRNKFLQAMQAEGIPCMGGYETLPWDIYIKEAFDTRGGRRIFPPEMLKKWPERCRVPQYDKLCREAVWFTQTMFLGDRTDMDEIAAAARKIHAHAAELAKA